MPIEPPSACHFDEMSSGMSECSVTRDDQMVDNDIAFKCQRSIGIEENRIIDLSYFHFIGRSIMFIDKIKMISNVNFESKKIFQE